MAPTQLKLKTINDSPYSIAEDMALKPFNFYKDFYDYYLAKLRETRQRLFPEWVKPDWYVE